MKDTQDPWDSLTWMQHLSACKTTGAAHLSGHTHYWFTMDQNTPFQLMQADTSSLLRRTYSFLETTLLEGHPGFSQDFGHAKLSTSNSISSISPIECRLHLLGCQLALCQRSLWFSVQAIWISSKVLPKKLESRKPGQINTIKCLSLLSCIWRLRQEPPLVSTLLIQCLQHLAS